MDDLPAVKGNFFFCCCDYTFFCWTLLM